MGSRVVLPKGSYLFHGTSALELSGGRLLPGLDGMVWFAGNPAIAQMYIKQHGRVGFTADQILDPRFEDRGRRLDQVRRYLGLEHDPYKYVWEMPDPRGWRESDELIKKRRELASREKRVKKYEEEIRETKREGDAERAEAFRGFIKSLEKKIRRVKDLITSMRRAASKDKLKMLLRDRGIFPVEGSGFKSPIAGDLYDFMFTEDDRLVLPGEGEADGRLYIAKTKRDMILQSTATGDEDSFIDPAFGDFEAFEEAKRDGYDGVLIDDYAQSEGEFHTLHLSVGLFPENVKDLQIRVIPAIHRFNLNSVKTPEWRGEITDLRRLMMGGRVASRYIGK